MAEYKVRLESGRILGPLGLERVQQLIESNHILGSEQARVYPDGNWVSISSIPEIADLLLVQVQKQFADEVQNERPIAVGAEGRIVPIVPAESKEPSEGVRILRAVEPVQGEPPELPAPEATLIEQTERADLTQVDLRPDHERTAIQELRRSGDVAVESVKPELPIADEWQPSSWSSKADQVTVMLEREPEGSIKGKSRFSQLFVILIILLGAMELFGPSVPKKGPQEKKSKLIRYQPKLPSITEGKSDPVKSEKLYQQAVGWYVRDTLPGYVKSAELLRQVLSSDPEHTKAIALLASSYINLIEVSDQDDRTLGVIAKLLELARAKSIDLPETVIADVEFYLMVNNSEAAQNRIVEYTKVQPQFGPEMFTYLAAVFMARGDLRNASKFINKITDDQVYSPKVHYLRGQIAERLSDVPLAVQEYSRALKMFTDHGRAQYRIALLGHRSGALQQVGSHIRHLVQNPDQLSKQELAQTYYLLSQLETLEKRSDPALAAIEKAHALDPENTDLRFEYYTLRARAGDQIGKNQNEAKMYLYLSDGERLEREGRPEEALGQYLEARRFHLKSPIPAEKLGDYFWKRGDLADARENYRVAIELAEKDLDIAVKYIRSLIQTYEWEEALKAIEKIRKNNGGDSRLDQLAGDLYAKQNRHTEAQMYYKKALRRETVDSQLYLSYAGSLLATKRFDEAPFYYAMALRFDPLNRQALIGTAQSIAGKQSIDRAIVYLQDELQKGRIPQAELLAAIADFYFQKGDLSVAQQYVNESIKADAKLGAPWKVQAQIYVALEGREKGVYEKALAAFKSYSDRSRADPTGYIERFRLLLKKNRFEEADQELQEVYGIYPKFPYLHYYKGYLYSTMGNFQEAIAEYREELKNNPSAVIARVQLGKDLLEVGQLDEAQKALTEAMRLAPTASEPKHWAGYAAYLQKNLPTAIALYQAAIELDSGNPLLYKRLGQAYWAMGDRVQARRSFRRYLELDPAAKDKAEIEKLL